jgi:RNA dependent RNA polymerase
MNRSGTFQARPPSVIQIRCGGLKGVLADAPNLMGDTIEYRPSQAKFPSNHLELEIISHSQASTYSIQDIHSHKSYACVI